MRCCGQMPGSGLLGVFARPFAALVSLLALTQLHVVHSQASPSRHGRAALLITRPTAGGVSAADAGVSAASVALGGQSALVLSVTVCGRRPRTREGPPIAALDIQPYFEQGWDSVAATWQYCSGNKLWVLPNASQYINVDAGCQYGWYAGDCDAQFDTMMRYTKRAYQLVASRLRRAHAWHMYVVPKYTAACTWGGRGDVMGVDLWATSDDSKEPSTIMHELGHTMGLGHASLARPGLVDSAVIEVLGGNARAPLNLEYGDFSSAMSGTFNFPLCFSLPEQRLLGWQQPITLDATSLPPGTWKALTMPDTLADPRAGIRIDPNWIRPHPGKYLYVSWVPGLGSNRGMHPAFQDKVYVHVHDDISGADVTNVVNVARLSPGQQWSISGMKWGDSSLVVRFHYMGGPMEGKLLAAVSICRRGPGQTCVQGKPGPPANDIYNFRLATATGRYSMQNGTDWDIRAYEGQWRRYIPVASAEDCATACFHLPSCFYYTFLTDMVWQTDTGLDENCFLGTQDAWRGKPINDSSSVSGNVVRSRRSRAAAARALGAAAPTKPARRPLRQ